MKTQKTPYVIFTLFILLTMLGSSLAMVKSPQHAGTISYIVQAANVDVASQRVQQVGGQVTSRLAIINGVAADLSTGAVARLQTMSDVLLTLNVKVEAAGENRIPATDYPDVVGADIVWAGGVTGEGITVAVVDTGLANHPGIDEKIIAWVDFVEGRHNPKDSSGHGTHVAGIIANAEMSSDGEWNGVAPGVNLAGVRVLDGEGQGTYVDVIEGLQWVLENKETYNIRVVNLSLVATPMSPYWADPLDQAVTQLWATGIVVVAAAGNGGSGPMSIGVPGNNPYVITVGAFTDNYTPNDWSDDYITPFSAAGPTLDGFVKPDLVAPGAHIVSTMKENTYLAQTYPENVLPKKYFSMAGTSQATAVASGVVALMLSENPNLTPDQVKFRLMGSAFPWVDLANDQALYSIWQQGMGRLNAPDAVFGEMDGLANVGMDIWADLNGDIHYEGFAFYDEETQTFRLGGDYGTWAGGFGTWAGDYAPYTGGFGTWAGGFGTWAGGFGTWAGGFGTWAGGFGTWAGGFGTWAGGFGTWAGGFGTWAGGFGTWAGGFGTWAGSEPWAGSLYAEPTYVQNFMDGVAPDVNASSASAGYVIDEP
ncbi:MAG: S8 family serine peptidase [Anaerolineales bacterium]|nr:S8 family serine peptidase [Anaerolineales bacterium]